MPDQTHGLIVLYRPGEIALVHEVGEVLPGVGAVLAYAQVEVYQAKNLIRKTMRKGGYIRKTFTQDGVITVTVFPRQWDWHFVMAGFDEWCGQEIAAFIQNNMGGFNAN